MSNREGFEVPLSGGADVVASRLAFDSLQALSLVVLRANGRQIPVLIGRDIRQEMAYSLAEEGYVQNVAGECWATSKGLAYFSLRAKDWGHDREVSHV